MTHPMCPGCQRRLPKQHGVHLGEEEMLLCTESRYKPELEPKSRDTWFDDRTRVSSPAPFTGGGV